ncbi:hypothetical protein SDJN02_27376, partial [Cucurbita argyrosperma subsp. argyrosperma]
MSYRGKEFELDALELRTILTSLVVGPSYMKQKHGTQDLCFSTRHLADLLFRLLSLAIRLSNSFSIFWLPKAGTTAVLTKE